jgi:hypothetical protein
MADELDELVAREFDVLEDIEVPELWERIVSLADTERIDPSRSRRRWPVLAAAAVVLTLVGVGLVVWLGDEPRPVDVPPAPAAGDNTVDIDIRDEDFDLDPTIVAGWVSFNIDNQTDHIREVAVYPLLPGKTYDDVHAALAVAPDGDPDTLPGTIFDAAVVGATSGPRDAFTVGVAVPTGDYVVVSHEVDGRLQLVPNSGRLHELRVLPGAAGQPPEPTLAYQIIGDTIIGPTSTDAGRITITLGDPDDEPRFLFLTNLSDGVTTAEYEHWGALRDAGQSDWNQAPLDSLTALWGTAAGRTLTIELDPGPIVISDLTNFEQGEPTPVIVVQVD